MRKIRLILLIVGAFFLLGGCAQSTVTGQAVDSTASTGEVKEVVIDMWNYGLTQSPADINKGDIVRLTVKGTSGTHGISIPGLGVTTDVIRPGYEQTIEFVASESGTFDYFCNVYCGHGHMQMTGSLVVN